VINTIWELKNEQGKSMKSFHDLAELANTHFKDIFKEPPIATLAEVMHIAQSFPRFVD